MHFCPKCRYYLYINSSSSDIRKYCKNCGFSEPFTVTKIEDAIILETNFRSGSSASGAASGITVSEYTKMDPTLPHVTTLRCPSASCPSVTEGKTSDVIYIKTDPANLKFQYICTLCDTQWTN